MLHYYDKTRGPELLIMINGETGNTDFTLPTGRTWQRLVDTQQYFDVPETLQQLGKPTRTSSNISLEAPETISGATYGVPQRSIVILQAQ